MWKHVVHFFVKHNITFFLFGWAFTNTSVCVNMHFTGLTENGRLSYDFKKVFIKFSGLAHEKTNRKEQ